ncbi:MAG: hypothetical protein IKF09_03490 [Clostridiales bacterium]|nr:hypothetical protein [Clostridiales bacterium]
MRKTLVSIVTVIMCIFMFAGCGAKTIEQKISDSQIQKICDEMKEDSYFQTYYKDVKLEIEGNHVTYKYYYKMDLDDDQIDQVKESLENSGLQSQIDGLKDDFKKDCGIRPDKLSFSYYTNDDKLIVTIEE